MRHLMFRKSSSYIATFLFFIILWQWFNKQQTRSSLRLSGNIDRHKCGWSSLESDGWFCESNEDWIRRKQLHNFQHKRNHVSDSRKFFFQNNWEPTVQCTFEQRLGNTGDGGKWVCDVYRYREINETKLLIYSIGSNADFSFERAIKENIPNSEIHTFDINDYQCPLNLCTFHQTLFGDGKTTNWKSLPMVMKELGHQQRILQILRIEINGDEYDFFDSLFESSTADGIEIPYIRQILLKIHLGKRKDVTTTQRAHHLFELFHKNHYVIFHKEVTSDNSANVFEYGFLKLNPSFFA